jgi:hypothetical protein
VTRLATEADMSGRYLHLPAVDEPEGRFTDVPPPAADRPVYKLLVRAEPGVDGVRALRWLLKGMLRRFGLRCLDIRREPPL